MPIVDLHALTTIADPKVLSSNTVDVAIDFLSIGLDPKKVLLYPQSAAPEVTELTWVFNTLITMPFLSRAHAFKDKTAQGIEATVGLFDYPVLMAADILIMDGELIPVGQDQKQHVEIARDIAEKFNNKYGDTFILPEAKVREEIAAIPGTDGRKMSKSYGNTIPLFSERDEIEKAVMSIPTDSQAVDAKKNPEEDHVFALHKLFAGDKLNNIQKGYEEGGLSYADSKKMLIESIDTFIAPLREKRKEIAGDRDAVLQILKNGGDQARSIAMKKMHEVREKVGLTL